MLEWGSHVCGRYCTGGGLGDGAADYVGSGSIYNEEEDEVQHRKSKIMVVGSGNGERVGKLVRR